MLKMAGAAVPASTPSQAVFTLYSFPPTKGGRDAICSYMEVLKRLCEMTEGKPLGVHNWEELKCRAPLYFAYQFSHEKFSQKLTHDQQSTAVWKKFKEIAPNRNFPAFPGHCEQGSTEGPPHWSWRLRSECSKAFWANPAVRSVRVHMKQSFLGKPCRGKSGTSLSGAICFFLPSRHGSLWILEIIHIYMCIYIYIVYFIVFKFKANCLGECSYVSREYRNYVLCSREPLSGMTSGSGPAL